MTHQKYPLLNFVLLIFWFRNLRYSKNTHYTCIMVIVWERHTVVEEMITCSTKWRYQKSKNGHFWLQQTQIYNTLFLSQSNLSFKWQVPTPWAHSSFIRKFQTIASEITGMAPGLGKEWGLLSSGRSSECPRVPNNTKTAQA